MTAGHRGLSTDETYIDSHALLQLFNTLGHDLKSHRHCFRYCFVIVCWFNTIELLVKPHFNFFYTIHKPEKIDYYFSPDTKFDFIKI